MKVKDLISQLQKFDPECNVHIPVTLTRSTIGQSPSASVRDAVKGIDWDNSTVYIRPDGNLVSLTEQQFEHFKSEFREAERLRHTFWRKGISDPVIIEKDMNPLFKSTGE